MKRILLDCWKVNETEGMRCENKFAPICFTKESSIDISREMPMLIEFQKRLVFTVVSRIELNDPNFDEISEHMDRRLFELVIGPIRKCVFDLADCVYARDFEGTVKMLGVLKDLVTNGQSALDKNKS